MAKSHDQIKTQVNASVERYAEKSLPRLGSIKLRIARSWQSAMNKAGRMPLDLSEGRYDNKLTRLERKEEKAERTYDRLFSWANSTPNTKIRERRLNSPRLKKAEERLSSRQDLTSKHKIKRTEKTQSRETKEAERRISLANRRQRLIDKKTDALARREIRYLKKDLRRDGYSRAEAKIITTDIDPKQRKKLGSLALENIALEAASKRNEDDLAVANNRVDSLNRSIDSTSDKIKNSQNEIKSLNSEILNTLLMTTWDDSAIDAHIQSLSAPYSSGTMPLDVFREITSLESLRDRYHDEQKLLISLKNDKKLLIKSRTDAQHDATSQKYEHDMAEVLLEQKIGRVASSMRALLQEITGQ